MFVEVSSPKEKKANILYEMDLKYGGIVSKWSMFCSYRNFGWFTNACIIADEWFTLEERSTRIVCPRLQMLWVVLLRLVVVSVAALLACVLIISFLSYRVSFFCFNLRWRRKRLKKYNCLPFWWQQALWNPSSQKSPTLLTSNPFPAS